MDISSTAGAHRIDRRRSPDGRLAGRSAVSWGAVAAGAAAAASLSLILLILGVGLGLSSVSPWAREGANAATIGLSTVLWLSLTQVLASSMGSYLAGRLRARWAEAHADEVYFRDTAHGFLAWAGTSLTTAALLGSVTASIVSGGVQASGSMAVTGTASAVVVGSAGGEQGPGTRDQGLEGSPMGYFVDVLFRPVAASAEQLASVSVVGAQARSSDKDTAEVARIFMNVSRAQLLPAEDMRYVGQVVAQRTGLSQ